MGRVRRPFRPLIQKSSAAAFRNFRRNDLTNHEKRLYLQSRAQIPSGPFAQRLRTSKSLWPGYSPPTANIRQQASRAAAMSLAESLK